MREHVTAFYDEFMHTEEGEPIRDKDKINRAILELRQAMNIELDLIREAAKESNNL
jgi:cell division FtsZ-interacting protein ZapD